LHVVSGRRRLGILTAVVTALAGCQVSEGARSTQTLPPLGSPSNTVPPTTLVVPTNTGQAISSSTVALPAGACVFTPPPPTAEVTFEVATRLYTLDPATGAASCLTELTTDNVGPLLWSPAGDRVLLNSVTVFDGTQALFSGYFATNVRVSWSSPKGEALIAPALADDHLLWRSAGRAETRKDISFLARTDVAAYHPAGTHIFAGGLADDGSNGLFVASNRGKDPRLVARLDSSAARVTAIGPDPSGSVVYFVDDHADGTFHVHAVDLATSTVSDVVLLPEPITKLVVGTSAAAPIAYRIGDCGGATRTQVAHNGSTVDQPAAFAGLSTTPVGWLDAQQLLLSVQPKGCDGPSDLWLWNITTTVASPLVNTVISSAVRSVLTEWGPMPGDAGGTGE
jgi:hypothetical protein